MTRVAEQTVQSYMAALAAKQSTPGGGAAAAVAAGQGIALLCMVLNFTVGRKRYRRHEDTLRPILVQCEDLWQETLHWADKDAAAFGAVMACYALPKATAEEKATRSRQLETALYAAADVPYDLLRSCATVLQQAKVVGELGNLTVLTDVVVSVQLLQAAAGSCETNIKINLKTVAPTRRRTEFLQTVRSLLQEVEANAWAALAVCRHRLDLPS